MITINEKAVTAVKYGTVTVRRIYLGSTPIFG